MKPAYFIAAAFAGALLPSAAFAQDATPAEVTLGVTAGYHDLGISDEVYDLTGVEVDDGSPIFGGFASVDFPVSDSVFIGAEGNLSIGTDAIDSDYGASARLGHRTPPVSTIPLATTSSAAASMFRSAARRCSASMSTRSRSTRCARPRASASASKRLGLDERGCLSGRAGGPFLASGANAERHFFAGRAAQLEEQRHHPRKIFGRQRCQFR